MKVAVGPQARPRPDQVVIGRYFRPSHPHAPERCNTGHSDADLPMCPTFGEEVLLPRNEWQTLPPTPHRIRPAQASGNTGLRGKCETDPGNTLGGPLKLLLQRTCTPCETMLYIDDNAEIEEGVMMVSGEAHLATARVTKTFKWEPGDFQLEVADYLQYEETQGTDITTEEVEFFRERTYEEITPRRGRASKHQANTPDTVQPLDDLLGLDALPVAAFARWGNSDTSIASPDPPALKRPGGPAQPAVGDMDPMFRPSAQLATAELDKEAIWDGCVSEEVTAAPVMAASFKTASGPLRDKNSRKWTARDVSPDILPKDNSIVRGTLPKPFLPPSAPRAPLFVASLPLQEPLGVRTLQSPVASRCLSKPDVTIPERARAHPSHRGPTKQLSNIGNALANATIPNQQLRRTRPEVRSENVKSLALAADQPVEVPDWTADLVNFPSPRKQQRPVTVIL